MKEKGSELSIYSSPKRRRLDLFFFFFFLKTQNLYRPKFSYRPKLAEIGRNGRNGPKHPEIWPEVERGGFRFRSSCRHEKFCPFRSERNGINNNVRDCVVKIALLRSRRQDRAAEIVLPRSRHPPLGQIIVTEIVPSRSCL